MTSSVPQRHTNALARLSSIFKDFSPKPEPLGIFDVKPIKEDRPEVYSNVSNWQKLDKEQREDLYTPAQKRMITAQKHQVKVTAAFHEALARQQYWKHPAFIVDPSSKRKGSNPSTGRGTNGLDSSATAELPSIPACAWQSCPQCRSMLRERAWISLDCALAQPDKTFDCDRPNLLSPSDQRIVQNLGLRLPSKRKFLSQEDYESTFVEDCKLDLDDDIHFQSFRLSLKRAFQDIMSRRRRRSRAFSSASAPSPPTTSSDLADLARLPDIDGDEGFDVTVWRALSDEMLDEAASVPLPDDEWDDIELDFGPEPVEVEGGVALTEEAVQNLAADVITQV
ncbi:MAG: hypothetical protein M1825_002004 [Sarcosagium campestre]|nr:MAG: hypothetical protein M1825_002004 [Sarcosagium campestre]